MKKTMAVLFAIMMMFSFAVCLGETCDDAAAAMAAAAKNKFIFELIDGHEQYIEGETFDGDVIISGDNAQITFVGCVFNGDIINTAEEWTRVMLFGCEVNGKCIVKNNLKEGTLETPLPKFMSDAPFEVVCEDCLGAAIYLGDFEGVFNGQTYTMADSSLFFDYSNPDANCVPYEGQEASCYFVAQWWENGEHILLVACEL